MGILKKAVVVAMQLLPRTSLPVTAEMSSFSVRSSQKLRLGIEIHVRTPRHVRWKKSDIMTGPCISFRIRRERIAKCVG